MFFLFGQRNLELFRLSLEHGKHPTLSNLSPLTLSLSISLSVTMAMNGDGGVRMTSSKLMHPPMHCLKTWSRWETHLPWCECHEQRSIHCLNSLSSHPGDEREKTLHLTLSNFLPPFFHLGRCISLQLSDDDRRIIGISTFCLWSELLLLIAVNVKGRHCIHPVVYSPRTSEMKPVVFEKLLNYREWE